MHKIRNFVISAIVFLPPLLSGCIQSRDYLGTKEGHFGLEIKKGFGGGEAAKDYFITPQGVVVGRSDSKNEVVSKIGSPDQIGRSLAGYECWVYKKRRLRLFFRGNYLNEWDRF